MGVYLIINHGDEIAALAGIIAGAAAVFVIVVGLIAVWRR